jgi:uncharacterized membrane protein
MANGNVLGVNSHKLAKGLGWFSIGLGLAEIFAPRQLARFLGVKSSPGLFRFLGAREIASGVGILLQSRPNKWVVSRVGGDVMDLGLLGAAFTRTRKPGGVAVATAAVAGVTILDTLCSRRLKESSAVKESGIHVRKSVTINRSSEELYRFWRDLQNLPLFMSHLESVQIMGDLRSHWIARGPVGLAVEWDADIIHDEPNVLIAWRSVKGSQLENAGTVRFEPAPGTRGTIVKVELQYSPPSGALGDKFAKLLGASPEQQVDLDLRQFKQLMETGEITTTVGQPAGRGKSTSEKFDYVKEEK